MKEITYRGNKYVIADEITINGNKGYILLEKEYVAPYDISGLDHEESLLKLDTNIHKEYDNGIEAFYIIDDETGLGVGYYGILKNDPELIV